MSMPAQDFSLHAHTVATIVTRSSLAFTGLYFGHHFRKLKNTLLAYEWYILGVSACCGIVVALDPSKPIVWLWDYLDAFSRLLGVPIIATIGLMRVTHQVRLTKRQESLLFAVSLIAALLFFTLDITVPIREPVYLVTMVGFGVPVVILIRHAFKADNKWEAWMLIAALPPYLYITPLDHYYYLPHNDTAIILNDDAAAHVGWAFLFAAIFFTYRGIVAADVSARSRFTAAV
jgi:hypothetical protein